MRVFSHTYGKNGGFYGGLNHKGGVWGNILQLRGCLDEWGIDFASSFRKRVGKGNMTLFWEDTWVGEGVVLKERFSRLFRLASRKKLTVEEMGEWRDGCWKWVWEWTREPRGRVIGEMSDLCKLLEEVAISKEEEDRWWWSLSDDGCFSVKALKELADSRLLEKDTRNIKRLWNKLVPRNVCIFIWRLSHGRIPVRKVLDDMGIDLHSVLCPSCQNVVEYIYHCFLWCERVRDVWVKVFSWLGLGDFNVWSTRELISFDGGGKGSKLLVWQAVVWSTLYFIWSSRNVTVFKNKDLCFPYLFGEM